MAGLNQLRNAINSTFCHRNGFNQLTRDLRFVMRDSTRSFLTEVEKQPQQSSSPAPFGYTPDGGVSRVTYGRLIGNNKYTLKTDVVNYLEGCNLTLDDVRVDYNRAFVPVGIVVRFASRSAFDHATKVIGRKGRLNRLEMDPSAHWDALQSYNGKVVVLQGLPRNAFPDDVDRFLSGYDYDASSMELFTWRPSSPDAMRMAIVRFPTQTQAMSAYITKNRNFCLNKQISVRVLQ